MLITNRAIYTKKYKSLLRGDSRLVVYNSILLVIVVNKAIVVYKDGRLKGIVMDCSMIFTGITIAIYTNTNTSWGENRICGISWQSHSIPYYYDKKLNTVSIYGYNMLQYEQDNYRYLSRDDTQRIFDKLLYC